MRRLVPLALALLAPLAARAHGGHAAGPPPAAAGFAVLVLPAGAAFRLLEVGPVSAGGRPVGLGLAHLSAAATREAALAEAEALWEYLRPRAEAQGQEAAAVLAHLGLKGKRPGPAWPVVWRRAPTGEWRRDPVEAVPFPEPGAPPPPLPARDAAAEAEARAAGAAWLALADAGRWAEAWEAASPILRAGGSQRRFAARALLAEEEEGKAEGRAPLGARLASALPGLPAGSYLVLEYRYAAAGKGAPGYEALTLARGEDGTWRAAAWVRRGPRTPHQP